MSPDKFLRVDGVLRRFPNWLRLSLMLALIATVAWVRWLFRDILEILPFLPFFPVVVISAFLFGTTFAYLASGISFLVAVFFFVPPYMSFHVHQAGLIASLLFLVVLIFTGWSVGTLRSLARRLVEAERGKSVLLNELNHRSKNNLQMMSSLLMMESERLNDPQAKQAFSETIGRIHVVGQIHTLLYQNDAADAVNAQEFVERLCRGLQTSFVGTRPIMISTQVAPLRLTMDKAVPLGIIINEAVTNALRHAFTSAGSGGVEVTLRVEDDTIILTVADNGAGLSPNRRQGLGSQLIEMMGQQLQGSARMLARQGGGTQVEVAAPL